MEALSGVGDGERRRGEGTADEGNPETPTSDEERQELTEDRLYALLSARRRRDLLRYLEESDGEAPLSAATRAVAQAGGVAPDADASEYKKVYVSLYQTHVPALAEAGVVEYDGDSRVVRLTPVAAPMFVHLHLDEAASTPAKRLLARVFGRSSPRD